MKFITRGIFMFFLGLICIACSQEESTVANTETQELL